MDPMTASVRFERGDESVGLEQPHYLRSAPLTAVREGDGAWDVRLDTTDGTQQWSDRMFRILGFSARTVRPSYISAVMDQPFWRALDASISHALTHGGLINVVGAFTDARGEQVDTWAIGDTSSTMSGEAIVQIHFCVHGLRDAHLVA